LGIDLSSSQTMLDRPKVKNLDGCSLCLKVSSIIFLARLTP
jgi:hypothetical protein